MTAQDTVAAVAFLAAGGALPQPGDGATCGRCGFAGAVMTPARQVVSNRFTGYARWVDPRSGALCTVCVWLYRHRPLRSDIHLVHRREQSLTPLSETKLAQVLSEPVPADVAVIVPSRAGRKHVFADAEWGQVAVDDVRLTWEHRDTELLAAMLRLREEGFTERSLHASVPKFETLLEVPGDRWGSVFADWEMLDAWRSAPPWWMVGERAVAA